MDTNQLILRCRQFLRSLNFQMMLHVRRRESNFLKINIISPDYAVSRLHRCNHAPRPRFSFVSSVHIYKRPNAIIPTAPIASGTPVAAAIPELLELPAVAELAADPVVAAVAKVLLAPLSTDEYDASAADCLEARELASERKELATDPVAVAASEERDAMADDAAAFADE